MVKKLVPNHEVSYIKSGNIVRGGDRKVDYSELENILTDDLANHSVKPFWNGFAHTISSELPIPTGTFKVNYESGNTKVLSGEVRAFGDKNIRFATGSLPVSDTTMECVKIRFYPNTAQRSGLAKAFGVHRFNYNKSVELWGTLPNKDKKWSLTGGYRHIIVPTEDKLPDDIKWQKDLPTDVRRGGYEAFVAAHNAALSNRIAGNTNEAKTFKYLSRKDKRQVCSMEKCCAKISPNSVKPIKLTPKKLFASNHYLRLGKYDRHALKLLGKEPPCDFEILKDGNKYYLCFPYKKTPLVVDKSIADFVALDPGIRTFQTYYSDQECGLIGNGFTKVLDKFNSRIDKLTSLLATNKLSYRTKCNLRRRCDKLRTKARNIVNDLHWKTASYLVTRFKVILIPAFSTPEATLRGSSVTRRRGLGLSHYRFRQVLKHKVRVTQGRRLIECSEGCTSITCDICGFVNKSNDSETFVCLRCKCSSHRDIHGARNVMIRSLSRYYVCTHGSDATR